MWSVIRRSPLKVVLTVGYLAFAIVYITIGFLPAQAVAEAVSGWLSIPAVGLGEAVTESYLSERQLYVPDEIVSVYRVGGKKLLMGHSTTAFVDLPRTRLGDEIFYEGRKYRVMRMRQEEVAKVDMLEVLKDTGADTLVLMTCAGENDSERLIIEAW